MKTLSRFSVSGWFVLPLVCALAPLVKAATLTISPATTSNTYTGVITLQIGGLTNTEAVVVQTYLDLNANGTVESNEPLMDTFPISDGGASIIGGKTNLNVPYDSDATGGAITATTFFAAPFVLENLTGQRIYRVVSPSGGFTPVEALFVVTNAALAQSVTGTVFNNALPATNAVVVALSQSGGYAGGVVSDSAGNYTLKLAVGNYQLLAALPNFYYDADNAPQVTLTNGVTATNNLYLTNGTVTLGGSVRDATNNTPLDGVFLLLQSGSYLAINFTASNGTYSAAVAPSFWRTDFGDDREARRGYLVPEDVPQVDTTTGAVANADILLSKGNALFYGRITNNLGAPFANVRFEGNDGQNDSPSLFKARGFSDANGNYAVAVLGGTNAWYCSPDSEGSSGLNNYIVSQGQSTVLSTGQAYNLNFTALPATARISGQVKDSDGNPVVGVGLNGNADIGGLHYNSAYTLTDGGGYYTFGVAPGQWYVQFSATGNNSENLANHGLEDLLGPYQVNIPPTNVVLNITVYPLGTPVLSAPQRISPTQTGFNVTGSINTTYTLQASTNLTLTNWTSLFSFQLTSSPFPIVDSQATNQQRFYRLLKN